MGKPSDIFTKITAEFKKPENYFLFLLGVLSEFVPGIKASYPSLAPLAQEFIPCFNDFKEDSSNPVLKEFEEMEKMFITPNDRKKYCEAMKTFISTGYVNCMSYNEQMKSTSLFAGLTGAAKGYTENLLLTKAEFCEKLGARSQLNCPDVKNFLTKRYKSLANYEKQCLYFHQRDCDQFNPASSGITDFAKKAFRYYNSIKAAGSCIGIKLKDPNPAIAQGLKDLLLQLLSSADFVKSAAGSALGFVANIMTFGTWGALKGGYHLVKLGFKIHDFFTNMAIDTSFKLGAIIGNAILIVKSILLGRRKRRKMIR